MNNYEVAEAIAQLTKDSFELDLISKNADGTYNDSSFGDNLTFNQYVEHSLNYLAEIGEISATDAENFQACIGSELFMLHYSVIIQSVLDSLA